MADRRDPWWWVLVVFAIGNAANALWMLADPAGWYVGLPAAVPDTGPLNTHFVRDIGSAFGVMSAALFLAAARPALLLREKLTDENLVIELYLWSLARHPSPRELAVGVEFVRSAGAQKDQAAQDLMWALLNSRDFLLVH